NLRDGPGQVLHVNDTLQWFYHDNPASDVAVLPWSPDDKQYEYTELPRAMFATADAIEAQGIGIGDELLVAGLFTQKHGHDRNLPILRSGIIAAMPVEPYHDDKT